MTHSVSFFQGFASTCSPWKCASCFGNTPFPSTSGTHAASCSVSSTSTGSSFLWICASQPSQISVPTSMVHGIGTGSCKTAILTLYLHLLSSPYISWKKQNNGLHILRKYEMTIEFLFLKLQPVFYSYLLVAIVIVILSVFVVT